MNQNRTAKNELAEALKAKFSKSKIALFADYKGLTAMQADDLRKRIRATDAEVQVLKNNVARLVTNEGALGEDAKNLMAGIVGPTLVAFGYKDFTTTAKVFHKFSLENEAIKLKDSLMDGKLLKVADVEALATLPSREVLLSMVLATMLAPITSFVRLVDAVAKKKESEGGAAEAPAAAETPSS
ncbi:MAG: 50S ribosomal protein L10 [Cryobacterium sp.]|nr:50S ribosomal protein L10 [Oligoflexia bacterium]